jgi:protein TonB
MAFEAVLQQGRATSRKWRRTTWTVSVLLHGAAISVGIAYSLWRVDELPLPTVSVTLTSGMPPPPPPPPAARKRSTSTPKTRPTQPATLVQPKEQPKAPKPQPEPEKEDSNEAGGVEGGVKGGVAGGVVGGVLGAPAPSGPRLVSPQVGRQQLLIDPNDERYRVNLPPPLARSGMRFFAIVRMCVSAEGAVTEARVLRGANPAIDSQIPTVFARWRYRPYTLDGRPTPFCYQLRYEISSR